MGHVSRALALAQELVQHEVSIVTSSSEELGVSFLSAYPFEIIEVSNDDEFLSEVRDRSPDLVVLDQLDTDRDYVRQLKQHSQKVVTFEDSGDGAREADLLISDLYENLEVPGSNQLTGISNTILAPSFEAIGGVAEFNYSVANVLILFGGTDPACLTEKTLGALASTAYSGFCTVVVGPGVKREISLEPYGLQGKVYSNVKFMPGLIREADLAVSSAGRTIAELISLGVPVLCMCQNNKELTHTHASARYGVVNIGLGELVDPPTIAAHIDRLISSPKLRRLLRSRALHETSGRRNIHTIRRIFAALDWEHRVL